MSRFVYQLSYSEDFEVETDSLGDSEDAVYEHLYEKFGGMGQEFSMQLLEFNP